MKTIEIKKRSGGVRTVVCPSAKRKREARAMIPKLQAIVRAVCDLDVTHGFCELRSPITNAARHVGYQFTLSFDLADFFDTVKADRHGGAIKSKVLASEWPHLWHDGVAKQGLPTSPIIANIAAAGMDANILAITHDANVAQVNLRFAYTRYGDDLAMSFNHAPLAEVLTRRVTQIVNDCGFKVNDRKTKLQSAASGRRIICGVAVDDHGIYPTRALKRRLRAAIHNAKTGKVKHFPRRQWTRYTKQCKHHGRTRLPKQVWLRRWLHARVRGLQEWAKLKMPSVGRRSAARIVETYEAGQALVEISQRKPCHEEHTVRS